MLIQYREGCLIEALKSGEVQAIGHQANCFNTMNSGVARAIREQLPEAYEADCRTPRGSLTKLGSVSVGFTEFGPVFNLYGQHAYGRDGKQYTDYDALEHALDKMAQMLWTSEFQGKIGFPKLGCGLGGGDWSVVSEMISQDFPFWEVIVYTK